MSLFSHKRRKATTTPKPKEKKSPMASMKAKFSFGKKKSHDEAEDVPEESEAEEEPAGPSESLETREQASHKTPAKTPAKSPPARAVLDCQIAALAPAAVFDKKGRRRAGASRGRRGRSGAGSTRVDARRPAEVGGDARRRERL